MPDYLWTEHRLRSWSCFIEFPEGQRAWHSDCPDCSEELTWWMPMLPHWAPMPQHVPMPCWPQMLDTSLEAASTDPFGRLHRAVPSVGMSSVQLLIFWTTSFQSKLMGRVLLIDEAGSQPTCQPLLLLLAYLDGNQPGLTGRGSSHAHERGSAAK